MSALQHALDDPPCLGWYVAHGGVESGLLGAFEHRAEAEGAGASVFRGVEGYGASNHIHTTRILSLSDDLPMAIVIVDADERIRMFLDDLDDLITEGLVIVEDVEVVKYVGRPPS